MSKIQFNQLPQAVQDALHPMMDEPDDEKFISSKLSGHNDVWAVPYLCYDFHESNYAAEAINLKKVGEIDVGPAMAILYVKEDSNQPAWIAIYADGGDTDNQLYECI